MDYVPSEFAIGGVFLPPLLMASILGIAATVVVALLLNRFRLSRFLSIATPKVVAMIKAILGQPNDGLRRFSSKTVCTTSSDGPFGPGLLPDPGDENSTRYFRRTRHRWSLKSVDGLTPAAILCNRLGEMNKVHSPRTSRSGDERFGARRRARARTSNCCFISRFSATSPRVPPGPAKRANTEKR